MTGPRSFARRATGARRASVPLLLAYLVAMGLLILSSVVDFDNARDLETTSANVAHTIEAQEKLRTIGNAVYISESAQLGFLLTGDATYLEPFRLAQQRIDSRLTEVSNAVSNTASQRAAVEQLRDLVQRKFAAIQETVDVHRDAGRDAALAQLARGDGIQTTVAVRDLIFAMYGEESRLLDRRRADAATAYSNAVRRGLMATIFVGLALTVFYLLILRFLRQRDAALRIVEGINAELEQRVAQRTDELAKLARHLLEVREDEKKIIARDLHDDFGSYLTAINMDVSRARDKIAATNPEQAAKLERTLGLLNSAIELKRQLISELRPSMLDNLGLGPALEQYIEEWSRRAGVRASFDHEGDLQSDVEGCAIAIFRVFQEALTNIAKHAQANRVAAYAYRTDAGIEFEIADDGIGLRDADRGKPGTHGLLGIRERVLAYGGEVEIQRGAERGTVIRGTMPCRLRAADAPVLPEPSTP